MNIFYISRIIPENDLPTINQNIEPDLQDRSPRCLRLRKGFSRFKRIFDLGLLSDKVYLNLMIGIGIAVSTEIIFSLLTPFILMELGFSIEQITIFMSTVAAADILSRFLSPHIGDFFKQPPRIMLMYALFMAIITRTCLIFTQSFRGMISIAVCVGIARGLRAVYVSSVISSYIPSDRLSAASGLQIVTNGVFLMSLGIFVGMKIIFLGFSIS